ncbi:MAG TPA: hypothetical protein VFS91_00425 [Nitrobacter sp.]|nr:hypothetical protein [Nitrobacter sp.]
MIYQVVGELISGEFQRAGACRICRGEDLDRRPAREDITDRGVDAISTFVGVFDRKIFGVVDEVKIVAGTTFHPIGASRSVE